MIAAILHDTVKDTEATLDDIEESFGLQVRSLVAEVTDNKTMSVLEQKKHRIINAANLSPEAKLINIADKIDNLSVLLHHPPQDWTPDQIKGYAAWTWHEALGYLGTYTALEAILQSLINSIGITHKNADEWLQIYYDLIK